MLRRSLPFILLSLCIQNMGSTQTFDEFLTHLRSTTDSSEKESLVSDFISHHSVPVVEGTKVYFVYHGNATSVSVPSELNRWNPSRSMMRRAAETNLFYYSDSLPVNGRLEYKLLVDSTWILDPLNTRRSRGGFGENSDVWMQQYHHSTDEVISKVVPRGRLDTIWIESQHLKRSNPMYVYLPAGYSSQTDYPILLVTDGGDYLDYGQMQHVLDNLIEQKRMRPVIATFIDPRTNPSDNSTNRRMIDYSASQAFITFLERDLLPRLEKDYSVDRHIESRVIMGASMGGLISTHAVLQRPQFIKKCAAQSPAYLQADSAVIKMVETLQHIDALLFIQTGTINDTQLEARLVSRILRERGATIRYEEYPEGHNWTNWRGKLGRILEYFFPPQ